MIGKMKKYKAIDAKKVAKSMLYLALNEENNSIIDSNILEEIVKKNDL